MFKLVQWAFKLGQQVERRRIDGILQSQYRTLPYRMDLGKEDVEKEVMYRADQVVNNILDEIRRPQNFEPPAEYSLLYPKGGDDV